MTDIEISLCDQGSPEWQGLRLGIPTASAFTAIMAKGRGSAESRTRQSYLYKLAGELITGQPMEGFTNVHMERGKALEDEARTTYTFLTEAHCERVGFVRNGRKGASPDALVGADGLLEIKTKLPHLLIEALLRGEFPPEHNAQCQGQLWITGRAWVDLVIYWPGLPMIITRAWRDEGFIHELAQAVDVFNTELDVIVDRIRSHASVKAA